MVLLQYACSKIKKIEVMFNDRLDDRPGLARKLYLVADLFISMIIYGSGITDYFQYQFYKRSHAERKNFIVYRKRMWLVKKMNDRFSRTIFDNKVEFNRHFEKYLGRRWIDINSCSFSEFESFAMQLKKFMVKPIYGSHGKGIEIYEVNAWTDLKDLFVKLQEKEVLTEELISQNKKMAAFNPSSVNTLRVVTLLGKDNKIHIVTANIRLGHGVERFADNFHHNGIAALVNIRNGCVSTPGVDKNLIKYEYHPLSKIMIKGFEVPHWKKVIETVKHAAMVVSSVRYVGWDLAVGKNGQIILIEGNAAADPDISQMPDQVGKWPLFKSILNGSSTEGFYHERND